MGLTGRSTGRGAVDAGTPIRQPGETLPVVALAGNPNVGKSTLFNALTGLRQHTGNWPGKTVATAVGECVHNGYRYRLVDIPGTYSLLPRSAEEAVAEEMLCFDAPDRVLVVCDATCLERSLHLVLQVMETGRPVTVCVNLMDEAARKGLSSDLSLLRQRLGVPVVGVTARRRQGLDALLETLATPAVPAPSPITYPPAVEAAVEALASLLEQQPLPVSPRWLALRLLEDSPAFEERARRALGDGLLDDPALQRAVAEQRRRLTAAGLWGDAFGDALAAGVVTAAARLCRGVVNHRPTRQAHLDRKVDRVLTGRYTAYPLMLLLLLGVFWLTMEGANAPSTALSTLLFWGQDRLTDLFTWLHAPAWLHGALVLGAYRVLAWVVSVMLPPMAIFFPLFTLLEDVGYLPRVAYNLDRPFCRCHACGKQALTMCMGFGCNAAGVVGCRIIDSPRERLLAVLTNSFVPCNGRFPALTTLLTLLAAGTAAGALSGLWSAALLTGAVVLGVAVTLLVTRLLAATVLKGTPSSFTLELPPYRPPQVGQVLLRSVLDRTLFVLGRAAAVAAPAGLVLWTLSNVTLGGQNLLSHGAALLDPVGRALGMDGVILLAFLLGLPANEIVIPLMLMLYTAGGTLQPVGDLGSIQGVLAESGWTSLTAACTAVFMLFHWPCSTTLLTVKKETGSWRWAALAAVLPTAVGAALCLLLATVARFAGWGI